MGFGGSAGCALIENGLAGAKGVAVSPDGRSVYVGSYNDDAIVRFVRDTTTGALVPQGCVMDTGGGAVCAQTENGLNGAYGVAVSPDGRSVYIGSNLEDAIVRFDRTTTTGALTPMGCVMDTGGAAGCAQTANGLDGADHVAVSPDSMSVYVASSSDNAIVRFDRELLSAPANTTLPSISGTAQVGQQLVCSQGTWGSDPTTFTYQWRRDGQAIAGATSQIHTLTADDAGKTLTCEVTATNPAGSTSVTSQGVVVATSSSTPTSPGTGPVNPADMTAPVITSLKITSKFAPSSKATPVEVTTSKKKKKKKVKRGASIRYTLSENARVVLLIQRKKRGYKIKKKGKKKRSCVSNTKKNRRKLRSQIRSKYKKKKLTRKRLKREIRKAKCTLYKNRGTLTRSGIEGKNKVSFSGRIGKRRLARASYRLTATAIDPSGNVSKSKRRSFKIVKATKKKAKKK